MSEQHWNEHNAPEYEPPAGPSAEELAYDRYVREKVRRGMQAYREGRYITGDEFELWLARWATS